MQVTRINALQTGMCSPFNTTADLPDACVRVAEEFMRLPPFEGVCHTRIREGEYKIIPMKGDCDPGIFKLLFNNAMSSATSWGISSFDIKRRVLLDDLYIENGLMQELSTSACSLEDLRSSCLQTIEDMREGWVESDPNEYPDIGRKKDSRRFALFIKGEKGTKEDCLIRYLATKFGVREQVDCYEPWPNDRSIIYMWIDRGALPNIIEKFGFRFA